MAGYTFEPIYGGPEQVYGAASGANVPSPAPAQTGSAGTGATPPPDMGGGGGGQGYQPQAFNPFAYDPMLSAALSVSSPAADQAQAGQAGQSASLARMSSPPAPDMSHQSQSDVWVTVPVDKVEVRNGKGTVTPVYATGEGYKSPPSGNAIPPTPAAGRQQ